MAKEESKAEPMAKPDPKAPAVSDEYDNPEKPRNLSPGYIDSILPDHIRAMPGKAAE